MINIGCKSYDIRDFFDETFVQEYKEVSFEVLEVGKELYSWPIKVSEYEHITSLEEQIGNMRKNNFITWYPL